MDDSIIGGKYRVLGAIGKGGMATVHRAVHTGTGKHVALKLMAVGSSDANTAELVMRFEREARLAGNIETQHIVRVFDTGIDDTTGMPFMVMELLDGEDVNVLINRIGPMRPDLALRVTIQACIGLVKAHEAGVIHRDMKPSNLFLSKDEFGNVVVKLLDFGIAKAAMGQRIDAADSKTLTQTGAMLGSPHYMSPEQAMGLKTMDHRTDIWSLGVVLYKCASARTPHDSNDTVGQVIVSIVSKPAPSVQNYAPWVSPAIAKIVHRCLQMEPENRFQTAAELLDALKELLPGGWDIEPSMLAPMTDEERGSIKPRRSEGPGEGQATIVTSPMIFPRPAPLPKGMALPNDTQMDYALSNRPSQPSPHARRMVWVAGVAGALVLGGWGISRATSGSNATPVAAASTNMGTNPNANASPSGAPSAPISVARSVKIQISPASAEVDIDAVHADVSDGSVTFEGPLGSVHKVRVHADGRETTSDVVITEQGPMPPDVALAALVAAVTQKPSGASPKPGKPVKPPVANDKPAKPGAPPAGPAKPASPFDQKFE